MATSTRAGGSPVSDARSASTQDPSTALAESTVWSLSLMTRAFATSGWLLDELGDGRVSRRGRNELWINGIDAGRGKAVHAASDWLGARRLTAFVNCLRIPDGSISVGPGHRDLLDFLGLSRRKPG